MLRAAAGAVALIGLAAIGVAARKSPELGALVPRSSAGLAQLSSSLAAEPVALQPASSAAQPASAGQAGSAATGLALPVGTEVAALPPADDSDRPCPEPEAAPASAGPSKASLEQPSQRKAATPPPLVDLNSADERQLQRLPGVGAKRAKAIIALRERLGGFRAASDLLRIRGIGRRTLERMGQQLVVGAWSRAAGPTGESQALNAVERPAASPPPRSAGR